MTSLSAVLEVIAYKKLWNIYGVKKMSKIIVFDRFGTPAYTSEENYEAYVQDAYKINTCKEFTSLEQLADYLSNYTDNEIEIRR
jgi:hypothetical protein